jgi:hypothetical protein
MKTSKRSLVSIAVLTILGGAFPSAASPARTPERDVDASNNVKLVVDFPYENEEKDFFSGGTDIDFSGKYVYAMQQGMANGGVHVIKNGPKPKKLAFIPCPGGQNDVAVVKPGLIALGYHESNCAGAPGGGVRLIDVRNPKRPKYLGAINDLPGGTHTLTTYPGEDIIYASPGGLPTNGGAVEQIIDVSDPKKPKVAATFTPNRSGCHDFAFYISGDTKLGFCAGATEAQIWDVSDPSAPVILSHIADPVAQFPHSVAVSHDGKLMLLGDEAIAGNDCVGGPTGAIVAYDISDPTLPIPQGYYGLDRAPLYPAGSADIPDNPVTGPGRNTWCSAHLFNFVPGTYTMVGSWYAGGMNVIDWSDPMSPIEVAHYMGNEADITNYWSAYWYDGKIWANDRVKGLDVFTVKGLKEGKHNH